ncbi:astacin [Dictyocaulus viviparus]|uniref:Metalloendopeptidase n=1 Tax=Dictyocaulus viviparus TaxID=29172 RepID=A0A0D8X9W2_DICVI|nr:astacin [Dictyocaulus viviparus]
MLYNTKVTHDFYRDLLFQGDIRIPTPVLRDIVEEATLRRKRTAFRNRNYPSTIWKAGVPFAFHRSLSTTGRRSVLAAIQFFRQHTCIRFKRRTNEPVYLLFTGHDEGCWSTVGRDALQGQQIVSIGPGCEPFGLSSHELAHALGLFHEQSRYDRDSWITIYPRRILQSYLYNFAKVGRNQMETYGTPYDIGSVMHYTPFEFSINPEVPSMIAVNINEQGNMGQLEGPSYLDVVKLNRHYFCVARCPYRIRCFNGGIQNPNNCKICKCPPGYGGNLCADLEASSIHRCNGRLYARKIPQRLRLKIAAAPRASKPRTCIYHILLVLENVKGSCIPGCWREAVEFKVRYDKRITGNRFCCVLSSRKRILSNSPVVPLILKAIRGSTEIVFQYRFVESNVAYDSGKNVSQDYDKITFDEGQLITGDNNEFEMETQNPITENGGNEIKLLSRDGTETENVPKIDEAISDGADVLPELETDLEAMVNDNNNVEFDVVI